VYICYNKQYYAPPTRYNKQQPLVVLVHIVESDNVGEGKGEAIFILQNKKGESDL